MPELELSSKTKFQTSHKKYQEFYLYLNVMLYLFLPPLQIICSTIAATKHYLHMTLYMWMFVEGINLFIKMVKVFATGLKRQYLTYILLGWGKKACNIKE